MIGPTKTGYWKKCQKKGKTTKQNAIPKPKKFYLLRKIDENCCMLLSEKKVLLEIQNCYGSKKYDFKVKKFSKLDEHLFFFFYNILLEDDKIDKKFKEDLLLIENLKFPFLLVEISAKNKKFTIEDMVTKKIVEDISIEVLPKIKAEQIGKVLSCQVTKAYN